MTIVQYTHFFLLFALGLIAAIGVFVRGRKGLGLFMATTYVVNAVGMQYIIHSPFVPSFSENMPLAYSIVRVVTDSSLFAYLICVAIACWGHIAASPPVKQTH